MDHLKGFIELTMIDILEHAQWFSIQRLGTKSCGSSNKLDIHLKSKHYNSIGKGPEKPLWAGIAWLVLQHANFQLLNK